MLEAFAYILFSTTDGLTFALLATILTYLQVGK